MRIVYKRQSNGYEERVAMKDLVEGDQFRILAEDPEDALCGKGHVVYTAAENSYKNSDGIWTVPVTIVFVSFEQQRKT